MFQAAEAVRADDFDVFASEYFLQLAQSRQSHGETAAAFDRLQEAEKAAVPAGLFQHLFLHPVAFDLLPLAPLIDFSGPRFPKAGVEVRLRTQQRVGDCIPEFRRYDVAVACAVDLAEDRTPFAVTVTGDGKAVTGFDAAGVVVDCVEPSRHS